MENLYLVLIVAGLAGFVFWNSRRAKSAVAVAPVHVEAAAPAATESSAETGVTRYLKNLPPPPVLTGVTKYLRNLPKPAPETGVTRYLKTLKAPAKPETGVSRYIKGVSAAQSASSAVVTLEKLAESIPAPTRASGVARYLQAIESR